MSEEKEEKKQKKDSDIFPLPMVSPKELAEAKRKGDILGKEHWDKYGQGGSGIGPGRP